MMNDLENVRKFPSVLGVEENILLGCSRLTMDEQTSVILDELLRLRVDWEALLKRSIEQGMTPLLYKHLQSEPQWWHRVPEMMRMQLEQVYRQNIRRNRLLLLELDKLLATLNTAEVPVILMKELHLLHTVYREPGLRPIGDLDLLVPKKDFDRAKNILGEAGYQPLLAANPFKDKYGFGHHFVNKSKGIWIDLQWNLSQREWAQSERRDREFRAPIEEVWNRARPGRLQKSRAWRMSWEDLLFHLCVHSEGHGFEEMIQFCDMAEVIRLYGENLNWRSFVDIARNSRVAGSVYCAFSFIRQVLGVSLADGILEQLRPDHLAFEIYKACFSPLSRLHTFLDESTNDASVPAAAMRRWEALVRNTAARNLQTYDLLTSITRALANEGLRPIALMTRKAERWLPHPALERVGEVEILVTEKPAQIAEENLGRADAAQHSQQQKQPADATGAFPDESSPACAITTRWRRDSGNCAPRQLIKRILQHRRQRHARPVSIHAVAPEEALLVLCLRFSRSASPWPALCMASEFLRNVSCGLSWQKFWDRAQQLNAARDAARALRCVAELTSVEIPAAALQPVQHLDAELRVELFPSAISERSPSPVLKQAIEKIYRLFLLTTVKDRTNYLTNLIGASYGAQGLFAKLWKPVADAFGFFLLLLRHKMRRRRRKPAALCAYWLEQPRLMDAAAAAPVCPSSTTAASQARWHELATA